MIFDFRPRTNTCEFSFGFVKCLFEVLSHWPGKWSCIFCVFMRETPEA